MGNDASPPFLGGGCDQLDHRPRVFGGRNRLAQESKCGQQHATSLVFHIWNGGSEGLLGKLLTMRVDCDWNMHVLGCRISKRPLEVYLPCGRAEQICTPHNMCHALVGVINGHCELVREQPITSPHYEVANIRLNALFPIALHVVHEGDVIV